MEDTFSNTSPYIHSSRDVSSPSLQLGHARILTHHSRLMRLFSGTQFYDTPSS